MNKHIEKANELRNAIPMCSNCAQTILKVYSNEIGITEEQASNMGANFGGGMKCGGTCGVITSALMVLGAMGKTDPSINKKVFDEIKANHDGLTDCKDLLKLNAERGYEKKPHCDSMIKEAINIIDNIIK